MTRHERGRWMSRLLVLGLALGMGSAFGHGTGDGMGHDAGDGMMGGQYGRYQGMGPGMMGGYQGMGPGMMGGYQGTGPGMMGGYQGTGPGMMGGYHGTGPGMMGSHLGMGAGMMGGMPGPFIEMLTAEQLQQARELTRTHRAAQFERMEEMAELRLDLQLLMQDSRPDPEQAGALNQRLAELHGAMFEERLRLHNALQKLLTAEQRERLGLPGS